MAMGKQVEPDDKLFWNFAIPRHSLPEKYP